MDLAKEILSDPVNKWVFSYIKKDIYLVGGYIRDLLRGEYTNRDKDYVLKDNIRNIALSASKKFKGTFIELKKGQTSRVALKNGQFLDFSYFKNKINNDLGKRDFTINAIAWSPVTGIIDPFHGESDLKCKIIRVINPDNLADDPLRVLRAYRIASQLGFDYAKGTRNYLRKHSGGLKDIASERITEELFKLLCNENATYYLCLSAQDKVLHKILDARNHNLDSNLMMLGRFDNFLSNLRNNKFKNLFKIKILPILNQHISQGLNREGLIRLSILLNSLHRNKEYKQEKLKYSNSVMKRLGKIHNMMSMSAGRITPSKLYDIYSAADDCEYEATLLVSVTRQRNVDKYLKRADDYIKFKKKPLLDGYEIQSVLNSDPSALIGKIQAEIQKRRFLGIIRKKAEAVQWILSNFT
jgi:tRNA nucleotidyltransferase (CCA-adding enzyme)